MYVCMYVCMYVRMYVCICLYVYVYVCMYVYLYIYIYIHTCFSLESIRTLSGSEGYQMVIQAHTWQVCASSLFRMGGRSSREPQNPENHLPGRCVCVLMMLMFSSLRDQIRISSFFDTYGGVLSHRATPSQKIHRWDLPIHNNHPAIGWPPWLWKSPYIFFPMLWVKDLHSLLAEVDELTKRRSQGYQRPGWDCGTMVGQWDNGKVTELVT